MESGSKTQRVIKQKSPFIHQKYGPFSPPHTSIHPPIIGGDVSVNVLVPYYLNSNSAENLQAQNQTINVVDVEQNWRSPQFSYLNDTGFSHQAQGQNTMTSASVVSTPRGSRVYTDKPGTSTLSPHINHKLT